jgi:hypothetical protein
MLRLKTVLIATLIAVPFVINAADFTTGVESKHGYWVKMAKANDSADFLTKGTFYQTKGGENTKSTGVWFGFKGDNLSGKAKLGVGFEHTTISDWYVQYDISDGLYFKLGRYGSPFGMKDIDNYLGQGKEGGKYGTSTPDNNITLGFSGVQVSLAPNDKKEATNGDSTKGALVAAKNGEMVGTWIPKLALAYDMSNDMIRFGVSTVLNVTQQNWVKAATTDTTSISLVGFAAATHFRLHVSSIWIQVSGLFGLNGNLADIGSGSGLTTVIIDGEAKSNTMMGFPVSVSFDVSDNVKLQAGFGTSIEKLGTEGAKNNTTMAINVGAQIKNTLPGFTIYPEFKYSTKTIGEADPTSDICLGVGSKWTF